MAVNVKLGVDIGEFKSGIQSGQAILKGLNAEMKNAESTFKATGNAEQKLASQTKTLNSTIQVQKGIADQARQALQQMAKAGVDPADVAYQKLYATMMNAEAGANEAQAALNGLTLSTGAAAEGADKLVTGLNGISKKISLDQVISGINSITSGLERAGKKAIEIGEDVWNTIMDSARLSDDILTQAGFLDMTPEQYQRYKGVFNTIGEVTISEWAATKRNIEKAMVDPSSDQMDVFRMLGLTGMGGKGGNTEILNIADNWEDVFWQVGSELQKRVESGEMSSAMADVYGEALFGKKYSSMKNLLKLGQEGFEAALNEQNIISDEALEKDAALNDAVIKLQDSFSALKAEVTSALAPALTDAANALDGVLGKVLEYLKTEEGKEMLQSLGDAVGKLFEDLGNIDPAKVVENFTSVFNSLIGGLQWIVDNKDTLVAALKVVVAGWAGLNLTGGALQILKLIDGLKSFGLIGGGAASGVANAAGSSLGGVGGTAFAHGANIAMNGTQVLSSTFLAPLFDWATHNTGLGQEYILGTREKGSWGKEISENVATFAEDWKNNNIYKFFESGVETIRQNVENTLKYWQEMGEVNKTAEDWTLSEHYSIDELTQMVQNGSPVPVEVAPTPEEGAAENIADQVGTITLPVEFQIRSDYANLQGYILKQLTGHANGLSYVPNEGLYHLHRGERVVPAREVASRSFSSNLYVENMNMGGNMSADALAAAIAGRNRRLMAGYGS